MALNAGIRTFLLEFYFPKLKFITEAKGAKLDVDEHIEENADGKWDINIKAMSKSKNEHLKNLFPKDISQWNSKEAFKKYGCRDVIKFFLDLENDKFLDAFLRIKEIDVKKIIDIYIANSFLGECENDPKSIRDKYLHEPWDFSTRIFHKGEVHDYTIYEAFFRYAHRCYTLLGFVINYGSTSSDKWEAIIKKGEEFLYKKVKETGGKIIIINNEEKIFPKVNISDYIDYMLIQKTLETVKSGNTYYEPTSLESFFGQLITAMKGRYRENYKEITSEKNEHAYKPTDKTKIKKYMKKIKDYTSDFKYIEECEKLKQNGTSKQKAEFLHRMIQHTGIRKNYTERELDTIHKLFLQGTKPPSLDKEFFNNDGDKPTSLYDKIEDDKFTSPEDRYIWSFYFTGAFRDVFRVDFTHDKNLERFLDCLPGHFNKHPFEMAPDGNLEMNYYSKKELFKTFCSICGITPANELRKQFIPMLNEAVTSINAANNKEGDKRENKHSL